VRLDVWSELIETELEDGKPTLIYDTEQPSTYDAIASLVEAMV
jgi:hypothetical protein